MKKQQRKNDERVGFLDISDSQAVLLRGIYELSTDSRYNM